MANNVDLSTSQLVAFPRASLGALRAALIRDTGGSFATFLQEAGYAGGDAVFASFAKWLAARGVRDPESLDVSAYQAHAADFFREMGWGSVAITPLHDVVAMVDSADWAESDTAAALPYPSCHYSTGLFADFFGRTADAPLAVLEVECRSAGSHRCRFLVGSAEVMGHLYERMAEGEGYEAAAEGLV
ncbi:MAG TPA: V4R domain-containing protein [Gemmatimonadaceae bacterium]|jgi:predicted hydrocarbon binding protein